MITKWHYGWKFHKKYQGSISPEADIKHNKEQECFIYFPRLHCPLLLTVDTSKRHRSEHFHFFSLNTSRNCPEALYCPINPAGVGRVLLVPSWFLICAFQTCRWSGFALSISSMYQFSMESRGKFVKGWCFNNGKAFLRPRPGSSLSCTNRGAIQLAPDQIHTGPIFNCSMRSDETQSNGDGQTERARGFMATGEIGNCLSIGRVHYFLFNLLMDFKYIIGSYLLHPKPLQRFRIVPNSFEQKRGLF